MNAAAALADKSIRQEIEVKARTSDPTVRAFLKGVFPSRVGLAGDVRRAAEAVGVDLSTIPVLSPEEQAKRRRSSSVRMAAEIARLKARVAELEAQLATRESGGPSVPVVYPVGTVAAIDAEDALARLEADSEAAGKEDDATNRDWDVTVADGLNEDEDGREIDRLEGFAPSPTPPPVPIRAKAAKPAQPRVRLEGFPPGALDLPPAESGLDQLLGDVDRAAHG